MKQVKTSLLIIAFTGFALVFTSCNKVDPNGVVTFTTGNVNITTDDLSPVSFNLSIDPPAPLASSITIEVNSAGGEEGKEFITDPDVRSGDINLEVAAGDTNATFTVIPQEDRIAYDDISIAFEIFEVGEGLETAGIIGLTSVLTIENLKVEPSSDLPFTEYFDQCDGGDGTLPAGWEERVITQNSLGTAHWVCAPGFDGVECNAFSADGMEGDESEVWLISPAIDLGSATHPLLSFLTDRRFETAAFQEYDVKISKDYDGSNFAEATWTVLAPAVTAIEANDPEADDYEAVSDLDLSAYVGEKINIAFIYYAEGSKFTATIFRVDDLEIVEAE